MSQFRKPIAFVAVCFSLLALGASELQQPHRASAQQASAAHASFEADAFVRTELFFGRNKPDGTEVTEQQFDEFLAEVITPRFPEGLTVVQGRGQFLNSQGMLVREATVVLIVLYPLEQRRDRSAKLEEIRELYKEEFQQESVLRVDNPLPVWVSF
jgi:hypothetical protein